MPEILKGILPLAFRGALLWAFLGFWEVAIIGGMTTSDPRSPQSVLDQVRGPSWILHSTLLFALAGGIWGAVYCVILAVFWNDGRRMPPPEFPLFVGRTPTVAEVKGRGPMLGASVLIGAGLGILFLPTVADQEWAQIGLGGLVGLFNGACVAVISTRLISRYSRYLR